MIGMRPIDFWESSPLEIYCAVDGFREWQIGESVEPLDKDDLDELMELYPDEI